MALNFNDAEKQNPIGELIPAGTKLKLSIKVRPGGSGEGGWLKDSKAGDKRMLDLELTVVQGEFARRKLWDLMTVEARDEEDEGTQTALNISRSRLRAILESARGIEPDDQSPAAEKKRQIDNYGTLDGLEFAATVRIEKDKSGVYPDKNRIGAILTPDHKDYAGVMSGNGVGQDRPAAKPAMAAAKSSKPGWA
jgi:hypothetical protein